jgi:uncharacterized protein (DUF4415 family)
MKPPYTRPLTPEELAARPDEYIDYSDIPELDEDWFKNAKVVPPRTRPNVSLRLPEDVINYFKEDSPKGFTTAMAAVLTAYVAHQKDKDKN